MNKISDESCTRAAAWESASKVLCIRLDNLGDVLMTTPALRALRGSGPTRRLTLLTSSSGAQLAPYLHDVDEVLVYNAPWVKNNHANAEADLAMIQTLRNAEFDAAVIFTVYSQSPLPAALMCRLAGIPRVLAHCRENPYQLLTEWLPEDEPHRTVRHEAQRQLALVALVGAQNRDERMSFALKEADRGKLGQKLAAYGISSSDRWMVVHCGASAPSRRYPAHKFAQALRLIGTQTTKIILTGDATEKQLTQAVLQMCGPGMDMIDLAGVLELGQLAWLIKDADLLLSNNTGPVHLAAALGTPVVDLYALTNPQHTPWMVPHRVLSHDVPCRYCYRSVCPQGHHDCLRKIAPEQVRDAVLELLAERRAKSSSAKLRLLERERYTC